MVLMSGNLAYLSQRETKDNEKLWNIMDAGFGGWFLSTVITVILYFVIKSSDETAVTTGAGLGIAVATTFLLAIWISYDASCLCGKMSPDEFMSSVVFFYTDLFILMAVILVLIACLCMGEGGGCEGGDFGGAAIDGGGIGGGAGAMESGGLYLGVGGIDGAVIADTGNAGLDEGENNFAENMDEAMAAV